MLEDRPFREAALWESMALVAGADPYLLDSRPLPMLLGDFWMPMLLLLRLPDSPSTKLGRVRLCKAYQRTTSRISVETF
jgi:hypothetical protein